MITDLAAFSGMEMENMTRGHGWRFLDIGRRLERAINLTAFLNGALAAPSPGALLEPLLEVADSTMTYRRRYFARPQLALVLDLLVKDHTNARALMFQIEALSVHVQHLPRDPRAPSPTREERLIAAAAVAVREADLDVLGDGIVGGEIGRLTDLLADVRRTLVGLSEAVTYFYFTHGQQRVS